MEIVATTSLPAVDRPNADRWNAAHSRQNDPEHIVDGAKVDKLEEKENYITNNLMESEKEGAKE